MKIYTVLENRGRIAVHASKDMPDSIINIVNRIKRIVSKEKIV